VFFCRVGDAPRSRISRGNAVTVSDDLAAAHALERAVDRRCVMIEAAPAAGRRRGQDRCHASTRSSHRNVRCLLPRLCVHTAEPDVVAALVAGLDTRAVTERLFISRQTV
jgi:hypothetical protein